MTEQEIDDTLKAIQIWDAEILDFEEKIKIAKKKKSDLVGELIANIQESSFQRNGKWYLVKTIKKTGTNTISVSDKKPGSHLIKEKKNDSQN